MKESNSTIDTRGERVIVTTGKLVTAFRRGDDIAAANQIASQHEHIERLRTACDLFIKHGTPVFDPASLSMWQLAQGLMWKSGDDSNEAARAAGGDGDE